MHYVVFINGRKMLGVFDTLDYATVVAKNTANVFKVEFPNEDTLQLTIECWINTGRVGDRVYVYAD